MAGAANSAVHGRHWKFTTLCREVNWGMMQKKISSASVGNATAGSIRSEVLSSLEFSETRRA
jgi:hypothetical protein